MPKKTTTKTYYYRRYYYKRRKQMGINYAKGRFDFASTVRKSSGNEYKFTETDASTWTVVNMLNGNSSWQRYANLFGYFKITGITLQFQPAIVANSLRYPYIVNLAYWPATPGNDPGFKRAIDNPYSIVANIQEHVRKYCRLYGSTQDYKDVNTGADLGQFRVCCNDSTQTTAGDDFIVKISIYCIFKNATA